MAKWVCKGPGEFRRGKNLFPFGEMGRTLWKGIIWLESYRPLIGKEFVYNVNDRNSQRYSGFFFIQDNIIDSAWSLSYNFTIELFGLNDLRSNEDKYCLT